MNQYHVHIYFEAQDLKLAYQLKDRAKMFGPFSKVLFYEKPVGPHSTGMIEAHFSEPSYGEAVIWLKANRGDLSVLIHQDTGDDHKDHREGICWLGRALPLHFEFFDLILEKPELRINSL